MLTQDEVPHSCAIVIDKFQESEKIVKIKATIHVEHDSQKGIIIGKKGTMLKNIGTQSVSLSGKEQGNGENGK